MDEDRLFQALRREVDLLGRVLGETIRRFEGEALFALEEEIRKEAKHLRQHPEDAGARARFWARIQGLSLEEAEALVRAFSHYFNLVNLAEEHHRVRVNRLRQAAATPEAPRPESIDALVQALKARGLDYEAARRHLEKVWLYLTLTAHPTEARRRTTRHHLEALFTLLDQAPLPVEALRARVELLWTTLELRRTRPTVKDEVKGGLYYLFTGIWEALPRLGEALDAAFVKYYGRPAGIAPPLAFRSWIGGDRDGNPNVTPEVTAWAQQYLREELSARYWRLTDGLIAALSTASERVRFPDWFEARLSRLEGETPLGDRFRGEPFRRYLLAMARRLEAGRYDDGGLVEDLEALRQGLLATGLAAAEERLVRPYWVRARVLGASGARLDLREESLAHAEAVAELLAAAGVHDDYLALAPRARLRLLTEELQTARPLAPAGYVPRSPALQNALGALSAWRDRGAYVVSMTRHPADLLEVFILAREVGDYQVGEGLPYDVVPLFETLADLERAPRVVAELLEHPVFSAHVRARGGLEVMIGYSDSNKDAGFLAANWALFTAQRAIYDAARARGVEVFFFHGRGTSTARGGGPAGRAIAALPRGTVGRRIRLTEQGEALMDRYIHPELAVRNLEQLLYHFVLATLGGEDAPEPAWQEALARASEASARAYRALVGAEGFFDFFEAFTPIREIAGLKIASRPVWRHGRVRDLKDIRAIPWVMAWTQVRANLPGWYALAEGLAEIDLATKRAMYARWPFFKSLLSAAAMSLAKADLDVAEAYLRLVPPALAARFFPSLKAAYHRTRAELEAIFQAPLLHDQPTLERAIRLRNPYVDPLNHLQVELLARYRALPPDHPDRARIERPLLLTLLGIAAGLRNTG